MCNSCTNTDVFQFSSEEMTYRAFVFTWGISSNLLWHCGHVSHACYTTAETWESQGWMLCVGGLCFKYMGNLLAATLWWLVPPAHVTTPPSLHIHAFVVAHTQASIQTSLPTATDVVTPPLLLWHRERTIKLNSCLKEELEIALPHMVLFLSSRKKWHLAEN